MSDNKEKIKYIVDSRKPFYGYGLELKHIEKDNLQTICKWRNNETILKYMNYDTKTNILSLTLWLKRIRTDYSELPFMVLKDGITIGYVEFKNFDSSGKKCEQGIFLDPDILGRGIGTRIYFLQEKVLHEMSIEDVILRIRKNNVRNFHIWEKIGAIIEHQDDEFYYLKSTQETRYNNFNIIARGWTYEGEWLGFLDEIKYD